MLIFEVFPPVKEPLVATFSETRAITSLKYIVKHSHKKRKDSLETRAELAVLRTYIENQAMTEPILLYWALKSKQTKEQGSEDCLWTHIFTFL